MRTFDWYQNRPWMTLNGVSRDCPKFLVPAIISGTGKAIDFKFGRYIHSVHPNKSTLKILEERERGHIQWLPQILKYPLLSQDHVKLQTSQILYALSYDASQQSPLAISGKVAVDVARDSRNFSRPSIYRAHRAVIFAIARLSCIAVSLFFLLAKFYAY